MIKILIIIIISLYSFVVGDLSEEILKNEKRIKDTIINTKWYDPRLKWNSTLSHNIDSISVLAKSIWLPDLFITNTADSNGFITVTDSNLAFIEKNGYVKLTLSLIGN